MSSYCEKLDCMTRGYWKLVHDQKQGDGRRLCYNEQHMYWLKCSGYNQSRCESGNTQTVTVIHLLF